MPDQAAKSTSSSSDNEMLRPQRRRKKDRDSTAWNYPRKAIRAVDSMGRINESSNLREPKKRNTASKKSMTKSVKEHARRHRRLLQLAKPKSVVSKKVEHVSAMSSKHLAKLTIKHRVAPTSVDYEKQLFEETEAIPGCRDALGIRKPTNMLVQYKTSKHTAKLAEPRVREEMGMHFPGRVVESALFVTASKRVIELAKPKSRPRSGSSLKENKTSRMSSGVSSSALKAVCSPRILRLSAPKNPRIFQNTKEAKTIPSQRDDTLIPNSGYC